jgi:hypothetical protein
VKALRDLDRRLVPAAARGLRRAVDRGQAVATGALATRRRATAAAAAALRGLDQRLTARGPLAGVRAVPQLALLLVAAVLAAGALSALALTEPAPSGPAPASGDPLRRAVLGVPPGADVEQHLADARALLEELAVRAPNDSSLALVSLDRHVPVAELETLVAPALLQRAYLEAPGVDRAEPIEVPLTPTSARVVLPALCQATAERKRAEAGELRTRAATVEAPTAEEQLQRADFEASAEAADAEAEAFSGPCATAYAVIVEAPARVLRDLLDRPAVRGVEAAPVGVTVADLAVSPLRPGTTGTLPAGNER